MAVGKIFIKFCFHTAALYVHIFYDLSCRDNKFKIIRPTVLTYPFVVTGVSTVIEENIVIKINLLSIVQVSHTNGAILLVTKHAYYMCLFQCCNFWLFHDTTFLPIFW